MSEKPYWADWLLIENICKAKIYMFPVRFYVSPEYDYWVIENPLNSEERVTVSNEEYEKWRSKIKTRYGLV